MDESAGFSDFLEQVRQGSEKAMERLIEEYSAHIRRVIRRRLHQKIRSKFDSADFEQAVWATFFAQRDQIPRMTNSRQLLLYLAHIAKHKVIDEHRRRMGTEKHDVRREVAPGSELLSLGGPGPRPSEEVRANDLLQRMLDGVPENYRKILELKLKGVSHVDIALALGVDPKTIQRMLRRIERRYVP